MKTFILFLGFLSTINTSQLKTINYCLETPTIIHPADTIQHFYLIQEAGKKIKDTTYFKREIINISDSLGIDYKYLMAIIHYESRFDTLIKNPRSSATGLIQFVKSTRTRIGLHNFSLKSQLSGILTYFSLVLPKNKKLNFTDVYLAVHYPVAIGRNIIYTSPSAAYYGNKEHDLNKDGIVYHSEISSILSKRYNGLGI